MTFEIIPPMKWVLCIDNAGYQASLEPRKLYEQVSDPVAESLGMIRVIDESQDSYLYDKGLFCEMPVTVNQFIDVALLRA